ncbi:MAG: hypothetical protein ACLRFE_02240 [Clostridia bacterium]
MEEISVKIKDAEWHNVIGFIEHWEDRADKPELYYKLSKLYETYNRAIKLSRHTWFENYKVPPIWYKHCGVLQLNEDGAEKLKEEIDDLNGIIYQHLMNFDHDIMEFIIRQYTLSIVYDKAKSFPNELSRIDLESVKVELIKKLNNNIFENKLTAKDVLDTYYYLLKLQKILKQLKSVQTNDEIEEMLKLISYTKSQLKQIVDELGCKMYVSNKKMIELEQRQKGIGDRFLNYKSAPMHGDMQ